VAHPNSLDVIDEYQFRLRSPGQTYMSTHRLLFGHGNTAAIFQVKPDITYDSYNQSISDSPLATIEEIESALASDVFDPSNIDLNTCCGHWSGEGLRQIMCSLHALEFTSSLYESMPDSTVSIEVMNKPLYRNSWATLIRPACVSNDTLPKRDMWWHLDPEYENSSFEDSDHEGAGEFDGSLETGEPEEAEDVEIDHIWTDVDFSTDSARTLPSGLDDSVMKRVPYMQLSRSFACIAWFDSGEFDIPLAHLNTVMALDNGDSIYVASALLSDPSATAKDTPIRRVFDNLGRSEMCLLVPPTDPRLAEPDLSAWKQINHADFCGKLQDCFSSTSLHLTFTDSEDAVYMGNRGLRDRQVVFLEALVSIDDRGKHIGDLDILSMFRKPTFKVQKTCSHTTEERAVIFDKCQLIAVDNWDEFLDPPEHTAIFRASGNWQARLGAAAAAIQMGKKILVLPPEKPCLQCLGTSVVDMVIA
jgi:hypothetical protein